MIATQDGQPLPTYRTTQPVPPERAAELVGRYRDPNTNQLACVTVLNGETYLQQGTFRYRLGAATDDGSILTDDTTGFGTWSNNLRASAYGSAIPSSSAWLTNHQTIFLRDGRGDRRVWLGPQHAVHS